MQRFPFTRRWFGILAVTTLCSELISVLVWHDPLFANIAFLLCAPGLVLADMLVKPWRPWLRGTWGK